MNRVSWALCLVAILSFAFGCSSGADVTSTPPDTRDMSGPVNGHALASLWQFRIDPASESIDLIPVRSGDLHMNIVSLLETQQKYFVSIEGQPIFNQGTVTVNIGITHPAAGVPRLTGFDVKGIIIADGSRIFQEFQAIKFAGVNDLKLLNADGWTRWWNPNVFPYNADNETQGYFDGKLGVPNETAGYTATLNPFKYFCDFLGPEDEITTLPTDNRGVFSAGVKNVRQYVIDFTPSGLVFNYAVDANWSPPLSNPPAIPDDFPSNANQPEPYRVNVHDVTNSLTYNTTTGESSGQIHAYVDVYSWYNPGLGSVSFHSADATVGGVCSFWPSGGTSEYSTYEVEGFAIDLGSTDDVFFWVIAQCLEPMGYNGFLPWDTQATFFPYYASVQEGG